MSYRFLMSIGAVVLLIPAVTMIDTQHIYWQPSWQVRIGLGAAGVLLALGAILLGRTPRQRHDRNRPEGQR